MYSLPSSCTFAALTIASAASTAPTNPLVSTIPSASKGISLSSLLSVVEIKTTKPGLRWRQPITASDKEQERQNKALSIADCRLAIEDWRFAVGGSGLSLQDCRLFCRCMHRLRDLSEKTK